MYATAPMGVLQAVQPPTQPAAAYVPQAPAAARLTPAAIPGLLPAANAELQDKQQQNALRPGVSADSAAAARSASAYSGWDVELEVPSSYGYATVTTSDAGAKLLGGRESLVAAQLMVQMGDDGADLPDQLNVTDLLSRLAERQAAQRASGGEQAANTTMNASSSRQQGLLPLPSYSALASAAAITVNPSGSTAPLSANGVLRRDSSGSVIAPRGPAAYKQTIERMDESASAQVPRNETPVEAVTSV